MSKSLLRLVDVSKNFSGVAALDEVTLEIVAGEICCLVGENGSGKSTLIKVLAGIYEPTSGQIEIDGNVVNSYRAIDAMRAGIQVIYQDFAQFPNLTVYENIAFGVEVVGRRFGVFSTKRARAIAAAALNRMNVAIDLDTLLGDLPMVDRQLVAIASALVKDARLIVMDEPTTALAQREVKSLLAIIHGLKDKGVAILFVSHKLDEVAEISDHTVVLRNGAKVADQVSSDFDRSSLVVAMTGKEVSYGHHVAVPVSADQRVLLELDKLGRTGCFSNVSLRLRSGEVIGITGLLGSGRDTLALSLFGLLPPTEGQVRIDGLPVRLDSVRTAMAHGIGYVPEDRLTEGLFLEDSIRDNIAVRTVSSMKNRTGLVSPRKLAATATDWVQRLRVLTPTIDQAAITLSGGNQQRLVLAKWLSGHPRILILNGPTVGVDVGSKVEIHGLVRALAADGIGVIVVSDDVPELLDVCHRILLMKDGLVDQDLERSSITAQTLNNLLGAA